MRGFTMIELLLVTAIILIVGTMGTGWYGRFFVQNEVDNTTDKVYQSLKKAQYYSMISRKSNANSWGVSYTGNVLRVFLTGNAALNEDTTVNSSVSVAGLSSITFSRLRGLPSSTGTITISGQNNTRTITLTSEGGISK